MSDAIAGIDTTPPTITIGPPSVSSTNSGPVSYTITYADAHFGTSTLVPDDITLDSTGDITVGSKILTGSGLTYTVTIGSITGNGTLRIKIAASTASDKAGNLVPAGTSATFTVDKIPPSFSWISPTPCSTTPPCHYAVNNQTIQLAVNAGDNVGISRVVFTRLNYRTGIWITIGTLTSPPFSLNFNTSVLLPEDNQIDAIAYDAANNSTAIVIFLDHTNIWKNYLPVIKR